MHGGSEAYRKYRKADAYVAFQIVISQCRLRTRYRTPRMSYTAVTDVIIAYVLYATYSIYLHVLVVSVGPVSLPTGKNRENG